MPKDRAFDPDLLDALPTIAWTNSASGEVNFYNKRWYDYTGLTFNETKDWGWKSVIHPDDLQYNLDTYAAILASGEEGSFEVRELGADGIYRYHLVRTNPVRDVEGNIKFWIGTATDIQALKDLERQKDEFLSIASHELKTPLTSIKAFNQMMCRQNEPERLRSFAEKSATHIRRLEKLVQDLLDVSRINAGKMSYLPVPFDFNLMLQEVAENMQQIAPLHRIVMRYSDYLTYTGDQVRLEQVLLNLLGNAIKYAPSGGDIIIESRIVQHGVVVSIQDFGIGIAPKHLYSLFDRYYRIDNTAMRFEGLGLGLFISAEIIKRHGGSLWIESELGKGSTFFFRLPLHPHGHVEPIIDTDDYYSDAFITMGRNGDRIEMTWHGFQDLKSIQQACRRLHQMVIFAKVSKILADNTYVAGDWSEASDWVAGNFLPQLDLAGVKQLAWVMSQSAFSQLAEQRTVARFEGNIAISFFASRKDASNWLIDDGENDHY
jgi:PAS domain S-box-containing protein